MNICFVYKEDYPWDVRVEKIVKTLQKDGHSVTLLCRNTKRLPRREVYDGIKICRLPAYSRLIGRLGSIIDLPFYINPVWFFYILRTVRDSSSQLLIIRDLPLMPCALLVSFLTGAKVIFDMAECYPEMYKSKLMFSKGFEKFKLIIIKNHKIANIFEKIAISKADHVFAMIEESYYRLLLKGVPSNKISIVSNTPIVRADLQRKKHSGDKIRLLYVGFLGPTRGIDNILHGMAEYYKQGCPDRQVSIDIVGVDPHKEQLIQLSRSLCIERYVCFHGWGSRELVAKLYADCNVGVLTYHVTPHWNTTIPNKLFDYMLHGLPVIASNIEPIKRIVKKTRCGIVTNAQNYIDVANALFILTDQTIRQKFSNNGQSAVYNKFNWFNDASCLIAALDRFR